MSEQGLEVLESTFQKTHEWIGTLAAQSHLDKGDAYKALRAVLLTLRDRLPGSHGLLPPHLAPKRTTRKE